jgi:hypothetical protein
VVQVVGSESQERGKFPGLQQGVGIRKKENKSRESVLLSSWVAAPACEGLDE